MTVDIRDVKTFANLEKSFTLEEFWGMIEDNLPVRVGTNPTPEEAQEEMRNREHTKMFLAEIQLRYPGMSLTEVRLRYLGAPHWHLVTESINAINAYRTITNGIAYQTITANIVRQEITKMERALGLPDTTPPPVPPPATPVDAFLTLLAARRGAYTWIPGPSKTFTEWVNSPLPLDYPLPITAEINCWEAVLAAAAEAGLVPMGALRGSHLNTGRPAGRPLKTRTTTERLLGFLISKGTEKVTHDPATPGKNDINAGDVIVIERNMQHVVAVVTPNREQYRRIQVMSLWNGVSGGIFGLVKLEEVLRDGWRFQHSSLKELAQQD
ncbi:hypothetical protein AB0F17_59420 [Nonomuraea sp. NPDC026600]|uniref:hypothetical protein n=1 Tax=Nonomuraea sp. NPDC026600 TaxID=3155363 RepID=UPI0033FBB291